MDGRQPWTVRAMQGEDIAAVVGLAAEEPTAPHWPVHEYYRMLDVIGSAPHRRGAWVLASVLSPGLAPGENGPAVELGGFAMASHTADTCELEAVVVRAALRGRRLGEALVREVGAWAALHGAERVQLEVRASNEAALRLYSRAGFAVDGRRRGYYRSPEEDAVLMSLTLRPQPAGTL